MLKKIKLYDDQKLIYIVYAVFILAASVALTSWATIYQDHIINMILKVLRYASYLGCAICIALNGVKQKYSKRTACFLTAMLITAGIAIFTSGERTVFLFVLLLGCVYASNGKTILKLSCILQGGVLFVIILCAITGITENLIVDEERMRYSLGFAWASYAPNLFLFVSMQYMLLRRNKITWLEIIAIELINIFIFLQTDTKMSFLVLTLLVCVMALNRIVVIRTYLLRVKQRLFSIERRHLIAVPWICALLALLLPLYRQDSILWKVLNSGFSGRLLLGKNAIMNYGFSFLGQKIDMNGFSVLGKNYEVYNYVDSSYLQIAIRYGIVLLALVCVLYGAALLKARKRKDGMLILFLIVILFLCIEEPFLFDVGFNLFPVLAFCDEDILGEFAFETSHIEESFIKEPDINETAVKPYFVKNKSQKRKNNKKRKKRS